MARAPNLIDLVRAALKRVEESSGVDPNDTAVRELKSSVIRNIAEREVRRAEVAQEGTDTAPELPELTPEDSAA
jgi:hypothetical protein